MTGIVCSLPTDGLWQAWKPLAWDTYRRVTTLVITQIFFKTGAARHPYWKELYLNIFYVFVPRVWKVTQAQLARPVLRVSKETKWVSRLHLLARANRHANRFQDSRFKRILQGIRLTLACCNSSRNQRSAHLAEVLLWLLLQKWPTKECCYCFHNLARLLAVILSHFNPGLEKVLYSVFRRLFVFREMAVCNQHTKHDSFIIPPPTLFFFL